MTAVLIAVLAGDLSKEKQTLVIKAIETYIGDVDDADAKVLMKNTKPNWLILLSLSPALRR